MKKQYIYRQVFRTVLFNLKKCCFQFFNILKIGTDLI